MQTELELEALKADAAVVAAPAAEPPVEKDDHLEPEQRARVSSAVWAVGVGLLVGWLGSIFFLDKLIGLSYPLFIAVLILAGLATMLRANVPAHARNLWLVLPILFFAAMFAVRADVATGNLNLLLSLGLGALWLHFLPRKQTVDESTAAEQFNGAVEAALSTSVIPFGELAHARHGLRLSEARRSGTAFAVGRGVLIALPILFVFTLLFSAADAVFNQALNDLWRSIGIQNLDALVRQSFLIAFLGWLGCGVAAYILLYQRREQKRAAVAAKAADDFSFEDAAPAANAQKRTKAKSRPLLLGMIESTVILVSVNILFGLFVLIQFGYFFGGQANVSSSGFTYAVYARRGFFELVTVAVLTLALVLVLDWITVRSGKRQQWLFRGLALLMVLFTGVLMLSASQRMSLYESVYGYTHMRVYTHLFIRWLAVLFVFFALALFRLRQNIFSLGVLVCLIGYGVSVNVMNVEGYIAQHNIEQYEAGEALDGAYLFSFSADALDPMLALWQNPNVPEASRMFAGQWLNWQYERLSRLRETSGGTIFSAHYSRDRAYALLSTLTLPEIDYNFWGGGAYFDARR
jgi:F0F1-type ATP synthase assembly protein I